MDPQVPQWAPYGKRCPSPEPSCTHKSLVNEPPSRFPSGAPMERDAHPQSLPLHIIWISSKGTTIQVPLTKIPQRGMLHFWSPPTISQSSQETDPPPQVPQQGPYEERHPFPEPSSTQPSMFTQQGPYRERCSVSRANGLFIHLCLSESPVKEPSHEMGENIQSPSMEPHRDGRLTYHGVRPVSRRGLFMSLLSLPQCHAAFSTIPSILAWIDQSPVSLRVS